MLLNTTLKIYHYHDLFISYNFKGNIYKSNLDWLNMPVNTTIILNGGKRELSGKIQRPP